ncbi:MAG: plastocyanin [Gammaproteobacteria bacterium]|nr:plastocyanin [Gammaproteobacteria bacterium]
MKAGIFATITLLILGLSTSASAEEVLVVIKNFQFTPAEVTIKAGQTVRWENQEKRQYHNVWFEALAEEEPEDYLFPDDSYQRKFDNPGNYPYRCGPHPEMLGNVRVIN